MVVTAKPQHWGDIHCSGGTGKTFCVYLYRGADKSLARPTSRCILFDGDNISFDASLVLYIYIYIYIYASLGFKGLIPILLPEDVDT